MDPRVAISYLVIFCLTLLPLQTTVPIPVAVQMLPITALIIYIGSKHTPAMETMKTKDAYMFPVIGSAVLFSLYLVYKLLPKEWITFVVKIYFFIFGVLCLAGQLSGVLSKLLPAATATRLNAVSVRFRIPSLPHIPIINPKPTETPEQKAKRIESEHQTVTMLDGICLLISAVAGYFYLAFNHWTANNLFGMAFAVQGIELISLGSFFNACILLSGLFVYDVFWVFGTEVMVTVAKNFDAPIKLLFPQPGFDDSGVRLRPSMLGLGDIVIPGIFIAMMLRYDYWRHQVKEFERTRTGPSPHTVDTHVATPFFRTSLISYFFGLTTTLAIMKYFEAAQPALLYLVPACLGSTLLLALVRGEFKALSSYKEDDPKESSDPSTEATAKKKT